MNLRVNDNGKIGQIMFLSLYKGIVVYNINDKFGDPTEDSPHEAKLSEVIIEVEVDGVWRPEVLAS